MSCSVRFFSPPGPKWLLLMATCQSLLLFIKLLSMVLFHVQFKSCTVQYTIQICCDTNYQLRRVYPNLLLLCQRRVYHASPDLHIPVQYKHCICYIYMSYTVRRNILYPWIRRLRTPWFGVLRWWCVINKHYSGHTRTHTQRLYTHN
jgi:hypothetical protein